MADGTGPDFGTKYTDVTIAALATAVTAADGTSYPASRVASMTVNDLVYARKLQVASLQASGGWVDPNG